MKWCNSVRHVRGRTNLDMIIIIRQMTMHSLVEQMKAVLIAPTLVTTVFTISKAVIIQAVTVRHSQIQRHLLSQVWIS